MFKLRVSDPGARPSLYDLILEGGGRTAALPITAQNNPVPTTTLQEYVFQLHEDQRFGWNSRFSHLELMSILSNLTAIKIRGPYSPNGN